MSIPGPNDITRHELSNGIVILVRENHSSPSVVISGYLNVGAYDEQPEQAGLAAFTASALMRGTTHRTFEHIYEGLESVGASVGISSSTHTTGFGTQSLAEDLPLALGTLADVLRHPTFPRDEIEKLRGEILTNLEERAHDTRRLAGLTFHELAYPKEHPYSRSPIGYTETISNLSRDDLVGFYAGGYGPHGMVIVMVGAVKTADALAQIETAFGDWEIETRVPPPYYERSPLPEVPRITEIREHTIPIPGKTQSDVVLGYPGPSRAAPDFLDATVCNTILGVFGLMGRLGEKVRDEQGLAYYSYSHVYGGPGPGPWRVSAGVNPANVERAIVSIRAEIRRICEEPVDEKELNDNKAFITGSLPLRLETNAGVAQAILNMEHYSLGLDYLRRYADLINEVSAERVQGVAQRWLDPDAFAIAIAGPPAT
ncbi:MAG: pitrilysin family protein [Chloroflexota bacterium]|nr:pitrilysin family protein [Chloroflexota bacterium]